MLDILVPPWNRISDALNPSLPKLGFIGLSCFAPRAPALPGEGLVRVNAHIDIVDWRSTRTFVGEAVALEAAIDHLAARRLGTVDSDEPTGLLTHHLVHDDDCWRFAERFLSVTAAHPAARWLSAAEAFGVNRR
jgi:hypothetical protein